MKKLLCIIIALICVFSVCSCSKFDEDYVYDGHSLIGKWIEKTKNYASYGAYEFFKDGTVKYTEYSYGIERSSITGTYTVEKNNLVEKYYYEYSDTVKFVEHRFSIKNDTIVMRELDQSNQMVEIDVIYIPYEDKFSEGDEELLGTWYDTEESGEFWTFNKDLTGFTSNGEFTYSIRYSVHKNKIYIAYESIPGVIDALVELKYNVRGDKLTIKGSGIKIVLERK